MYSYFNPITCHLRWNYNNDNINNNDNRSPLTVCASRRFALVRNNEVMDFYCPTKYHFKLVNNSPGTPCTVHIALRWRRRLRYKIYIYMIQTPLQETVLGEPVLSQVIVFESYNILRIKVYCTQKDNSRPCIRVARALDLYPFGGGRSPLPQDASSEPWRKKERCFLVMWYYHSAINFYSSCCCSCGDLKCDVNFPGTFF